MPRLENWIITNDIYSDCSRLVGEIYGDIRFPDGSLITTSRLKNIYFESEEAQTKNTLYALGKRKANCYIP